MASKAVFVDRDRTLMEDPGYISDPSAVKLLPGVELAIKSFQQAGFKTVVVTNQSGVARGLLTEETLEKIHAELRRQLAEKGAHLDAIYYCPYHPEGTVDNYAVDSDLRKPKPGMLLKAAKELDIDLRASWMVGDSPRDIEAGQRAGCRTVRVRTRSQPAGTQEEHEAVQADYTVRNLVDAAKVILRPALAAGPAALADDETGVTGEELSAEAAAAAVPPAGTATTDDVDLHREILRHVRRPADAARGDRFSLTRLFGAIVQVLAILTLLLVFWTMLTDAPIQQAILWAMIAVMLQVMALTFFLMHRTK